MQTTLRAFYTGPEQDLPADFDQRRDELYRELRKPLDPGVFIGRARQETLATHSRRHRHLP